MSVSGILALLACARAPREEDVLARMLMLQKRAVALDSPLPLSEWRSNNKK